MTLWMMPCQLSLSSSVIAAMMFVLSAAAAAAAVPGPINGTDSTLSADLVRADRKLLVILLGGFRPDYLSQLEGPVLTAAGDDHHLTQGVLNQGEGLHGAGGFARFLSGSGSRAQYLAPVFPSDSLPNLYSIITGLYPENHGIVSDVMHDPKYQDFFVREKAEEANQPFWWNATKPIWVDSVQAGIRTFVYKWPSCNVPINGTQPDLCQEYSDFEELTVFEENLKDVVFRMSRNQAQFGLVYSSHADNVAHSFGVDAPEMKESIVRTDAILGGMLADIDNSKSLREELNIVLLSDHGEKNLRENGKYVVLSDKINLDDIYFATGHGVTVGLYPKPGRQSKVYEQLNETDWANVWKRDDIPEVYHLKYNNRTPPILLSAKPGYYILPMTNTDKQIPHVIQLNAPKRSQAAHGYDPAISMDMNGIFMVRGPDFKKNVTVPKVNAVDVYNVMTCLLNITGHPNNGSWANAKAFLDVPCISGSATSAIPSLRIGAMFAMVALPVLFSGLL